MDSSNCGTPFFLLYVTECQTPSSSLETSLFAENRPLLAEWSVWGGTGVSPVLGGVPVFSPVSLVVGVGLAMSVWWSGSGVGPEVGGTLNGSDWGPSWLVGVGPFFSWVPGSEEGPGFIPDVSLVWVGVLGLGEGWGLLSPIRIGLEPARGIVHLANMSSLDGEGARQTVSSSVKPGLEAVDDGIGVCPYCGEVPGEGEELLSSVSIHK